MVDTLAPIMGMVLIFGGLTGIAVGFFMLMRNRQG